MGHFTECPARFIQPSKVPQRHYPHALGAWDAGGIWQTALGWPPSALLVEQPLMPWQAAPSSRPLRAVQGSRSSSFTKYGRHWRPLTSVGLRACRGKGGMDTQRCEVGIRTQAQGALLAAY